MKLSRCKHCGAAASLFAKNCPECGKRIYHPIFGCVVFVVLLMFFFLSLIKQVDEKKQLPQQNVEHNQPAINTEEQQQKDTGNLVLGPGTYQVGVDIPAGKYDCVAYSGFGVLRGEVAALSPAVFVMTMGSSSASIGDVSAGVEAASSYSNLTLTAGDTIYIEMSLNVEFIQK